jgi:hypothetical protein
MGEEEYTLEESDFCFNFVDLKVKLRTEINKINKLKLESSELKKIVKNINEILD